MANDDILRRLQDIVDYPHEDLEVEIKGWLNLRDEADRAKLAKAIIAVANHGGGYVLLGFREHGGTWQPDPCPSEDLANYSQDLVNGIVHKYAEPAFHCQSHNVPRTDSGMPFPVIVVPGGQTVPIRSKRDGPGGQGIQKNVYYVRRPGPMSEPPQTGQEWDSLIGKCVTSAREENLDKFREIINAALQARGMLSTGRPSRQDRFAAELEQWESACLAAWEAMVSGELASPEESPYRHGYWTATYLLAQKANRQLSLTNLKEILDQVRGHETGWPPWWVPSRAGIAPYPREGTIECWLLRDDPSKDPGHADFWRAALPPRMFLLRGYQEDSPSEQSKWDVGTVFDLTLPVWRVGEVLLHAGRLAQALGIPRTRVLAHFRWTGLAGRRLVSWAAPLRSVHSDRICRQKEVVSSLKFPAEAVPDSLPELVQVATRRLYESFDFASPEPAMFQEEIARMRSRRF
jgi:hypothetical protein